MSDADVLRALMEADRWVDRVRRQRERLPEAAELAALEDELRALAGELAESRAALAPVRSEYEDAQRESERLRTRATELTSALAASTGHARELSALQTEVVHVRDRLAEAEDRELDLLMAVEPLDESVQSVRERAQPAAARREELRGVVAQLQASLDEEIVSLTLDRASAAEAVPAELRSRYEHALARSGTSGAAQVIEGRCDGCRLQLAPLDVDRWKAQPAGTFLSCPSCGRLLLP